VAEQLTFTDFVELVLARLYDLSGNESVFIDVDEITAELNAPETWAFDAVQYLDERGYVKAALAFASSAALITGAGRMHVEEKQREADSITHQYRERPQIVQNFVSVSGSGHQVAVGVEGDVTQTSLAPETRDEILRLLVDIEAGIGSAEELSPSERGEYLADVETVRAQLKKREPNKMAISTVLTPLTQIAAIAGPVLEVLHMLGVA
jgi:hypothetical protein